MKLSDLQAGMRVRLRNNDVYDLYKINGCYIILKNKKECLTRRYRNDLTNYYRSNFDIMEVSKLNIIKNWLVIWKRDESDWDWYRKKYLKEDTRAWKDFEKLYIKNHNDNIQKEEKGMKELYNLIDKVYFNESKRTTTIKFKNGDISKATATVGTEFCEHAGFMAALFKYQYGKVKDLETFIKRKGVRQ